MPTTVVQSLPIPPHFNPEQVGEIWRVPYQERAIAARDWARHHNLQPAARDRTRIGLLAIDVQNTFCIPEFELFVGGRSGRGAIEDNQRLCEFIYRNLGVLTDIIPTLDTHAAIHIFHPIFWVNPVGEHPAPHTQITLADLKNDIWRVNPAIAEVVAQGDYPGLQQYVTHYIRRLSQDSKLPLTIWPYHAMLGGIGHALVAAVEEACFFHSISRQSLTQHEIKGRHPLTENYSALRPEVLEGTSGHSLAQKNTRLIETLLDYDAVIIAGQAKSHCVAWTVSDLLDEIQDRDPKLAQRVYLLEDCTSPVVIPDVIDYTDSANAAFDRCAEAGMQVVKSTDPVEAWPGFDLS